MATSPATSCCMRCLILLIITVATLNTPVALAGHSSSPPSVLVIYAHQNNVPPNATIVEAVSPSGNLSATEFGTTTVVADIIREGVAPDSPVLGMIAGQLVTEKDLSVYASTTYVLNTTGYAGSITIQGAADQRGEGELAITGGTYDFRFARGYVDLTLVSQQNPQDIVVKIVLYLRYD